MQNRFRIVNLEKLKQVEKLKIWKLEVETTIDFKCNWCNFSTVSNVSTFQHVNFPTFSITYESAFQYYEKLISWQVEGWQVEHYENLKCRKTVQVEEFNSWQVEKLNGGNFEESTHIVIENLKSWKRETLTSWNVEVLICWKTDIVRPWPVATNVTKLKVERLTQRTTKKRNVDILKSWK